jgi:hypothetical protein
MVADEGIVLLGSSGEPGGSAQGGRDPGLEPRGQSALEQFQRRGEQVALRQGDAVVLGVGTHPVKGSVGSLALNGRT